MVESTWYGAYSPSLRCSPFVTLLGRMWKSWMLHVRHHSTEAGFYVENGAGSSTCQNIDPNYN